MTVTSMYAEIVKTEKQEDGTLKVWGKASGPDLDSDKQICDPVWLQKAMPEWFVHGNVREQHSSIAAGVGTTLEQSGDNWNLESLIVDPSSVMKVDKGVLKGYSIGISGAKVVKDATAPGGRIVGGTIVEVSLVDRPANPTCVLTLAKSVDGTLTKVDDPAMDDMPDDAAEGDEVDLIGVARDALAQWLAQEAAEVGAGTGGTTVVQIIAGLLDRLDWAVDADACDDIEAAVESVKTLLATPKEDTVLTLATVAELVKSASADDAADADKVTITELRKSLGLDTVDTRITDAVTEAVAPLNEIIKGLSADMAKVNATVLDAGPVRVNTVNKADDTSEVVKSRAAEYRRLAGTVTDRETSRAYMELAARLLNTLA